jgi:hypothetical protein
LDFETAGKALPRRTDLDHHLAAVVQTEADHQ